MVHLSVSQQRQEYVQNSDYLAKLLHGIPIAMSHPRNSYSADTLDILRSLGIQIGFRALMKRGESLLELPRQDHAHILTMMR